MMLSPFPWIAFPEPRCPQSRVPASPRLRTTLDLRDFRGGKPSTSYRRLTQIRIDNLVSLKNPIFRRLPKRTLPGLTNFQNPRAGAPTVFLSRLELRLESSL